MMQLLTIDQSRSRLSSSAGERFPSNRLPRTFAEVACDPFFATAAGWLDADQRSVIADAVMEVVSVESGRRLPFSSHRSSSLYLMVQGWALRSLTLLDGSRQITDILLPGDLFDHHDADFDKIDDVRACGPARIATLRGLVEGERQEPALRRAMEWTHRRAGMTLRSRLATVGRRDARARVVHLLCELYHRLRPLGLARDGSFVCPMTQEQLADALGLTAVHVNRTLQVLLRRDVLTLRKRVVVISDLLRLNAEAGLDDKAFNITRGGQHEHSR